MVNAENTFLQDLNTAIVDMLLELSNHLNSGMISRFVDLEKDYDASDSKITIKCKGGVKNGESFLSLNVHDLNQNKGDSFLLEDYSLEIKSNRYENGGFGELIRLEINEMLNKESAVPDYVVQSLSSGYSCVNV